jgi:hypothetical protein
LNATVLTRRQPGKGPKASFYQSCSTPEPGLYRGRARFERPLIRRLEEAAVFRSIHISRSSRAIAVALACMTLAAPAAMARPATENPSGGDATSVPAELRYSHAIAPAEYRTSEPASPAPVADDGSPTPWDSLAAGIAVVAVMSGLALALIRVRSPRTGRFGAH